jgi:hypothetical protein
MRSFDPAGTFGGPDICGHKRRCGTCEFGREGLVSKHRVRAYRADTSPHLVKLKNQKHPAMNRVMESFR